MSGAEMFDRQMLEVAFSEIDVVRRSLPEEALTALATEVVSRVAVNLHSLPRDFGPNDEDIDALCDALLSETSYAATSYIENLRVLGVSYEDVCLAYLSVAARRLGERWSNDEITFYPVTIAAGRIYAILRILRLARPNVVPDMRRAATFASVPGDTHTLGITIATDLARERGWDIDLLIGLQHGDLLEQLNQRQPSVIGLSASGTRCLPALTRLIVALRLSNPDVRILICGQLATNTLSLVGITGADAAATSFDGAIEKMEGFLNIGRAKPA